jgi:putative two-component system response regulator
MLSVQGRTILIVDDSPENLSILSDLLQPFYQVRAATSGQKALKIASTPPQPDLILLDVMMPGMDGHQVFERLRKDSATCDIPVIFLTAMSGVDAEMHGLEAGAVLHCKADRAADSYGADSYATGTEAGEGLVARPE